MDELSNNGYWLTCIKLYLKDCGIHWFRSRPHSICADAIANIQTTFVHLLVLLPITWLITKISSGLDLIIELQIEIAKNLAWSVERMLSCGNVIDVVILVNSVERKNNKLKLCTKTGLLFLRKLVGALFLVVVTRMLCGPLLLLLNPPPRPTPTPVAPPNVALQS